MTVKQKNVTGVVLAGGDSRRMGKNKALLELGGRPMIAHVVDRLLPVVDEVIIASNQTTPYESFADRIVPDQFRGIGTLGGIHAGLSAASNDLVIVVGCDMPFLKPELLHWFINASSGFDVVLLKRGEWVEPLHATYRRTCIPAIENAIRANKRRIISFFGEVRVPMVHTYEFASIDPGLTSFRNINTPEEWHQAMREHPWDRI